MTVQEKQKTLYLRSSDFTRQLLATAKAQKADGWPVTKEKWQSGRLRRS